MDTYSFNTVCSAVLSIVRLDDVECREATIFMLRIRDITDEVEVQLIIVGMLFRCMDGWIVAERPVCGVVTAEDW